MVVGLFIIRKRNVYKSLYRQHRLRLIRTVHTLPCERLEVENEIEFERSWFGAGMSSPGVDEAACLDVNL